MACTDGGNSFEEVFGEEDVLDENDGAPRMFVNITIDATALGLTGDVNNFPLLVRLNTTNFPGIAAKTESGGANIRFTKTDGTTSLSYEIEDWVDGTSGTVWVLMDTVSSSSASTIKMYYNDAGAVSMSDSAAVFNTTNGFRGVWHLEENANTDPDGYKSATGSNHGTGNSMTNAAVEGLAGQAASFDGVDDYIYGSDAGFPSGLNVSSQSLWFKEIAHQDDDVPFAYGIIGSQNCRGMGLSSTTSLNFFGYGDATIFTVPAYGVDEWHHYVAIHDGTDAIVYFDGVYKGSQNQIDWNTVLDSFQIGKNVVGGSNLYNGIVDEVRISSAIRSADWIKLCYETQKAGQTVVTIP